MIIKRWLALSLFVTKTYGPKTPRVGLEPTSGNCQPIDNKELTENSNPVLATSLDKTLQKYPDLARLIEVWPTLPKQTKAKFTDLIEKHIMKGKADDGKKGKS